MSRYIWNPKTLLEIHDDIGFYRVSCFECNSPQENAKILRDATNRALGIRLDHPELPEVPLAKDMDCVTEQDFIRLEQWLVTAKGIIDAQEQEQPKKLYDEMDQFSMDLLRYKYGDGIFDGSRLIHPNPAFDFSAIPDESHVFQFRQHAIAILARYTAAGFELPEVPQGWLDIMQWLINTDKRIRAGEKNEDPAKSGSDEANTESASELRDSNSRERTYHCPSWDVVVTDQEVKSIKREFGPLADTLADLASMVREMSRVAPQEIDLDHKVKVVVEPTAGVRQLADEADIEDDLTVDPYTGESLDAAPGLVEWQSQETVGFLVRILASARKLRPNIEMVVGEGQARDCYVDMHKTLTYRHHNRGTGLVIRMCMQWRGVDGSVERLATRIEHWHRNLMLLVSGDGPKIPAARDPTPNRRGQLEGATKWSDILIEVVDDDTVKVKIGADQWRKLTYVELGFKDERHARANKLWVIFLSLAEQNRRTISGPKITPKDIQRLRNTLRSAFGLQGMPIRRYDRATKRYPCCFRFTDPRDW
jgi:hypothetical protein